ncbi:MAG: hypothetical protein R2746_00345 [Acidimicrobiales bacterium]
MVAVVALGALAGCGSDAGSEGDGVGATSTATVPRSTTTSATVPDGPLPIPTDPADLEACRDVDPGQPALMPSRRWPGIADGWAVRYAYTSRPEGEVGPPFGWSTLVQVGDAERVTALVVVTFGPKASGSGPDPNATVRGVPAWVGPEITRGGATGAVQAVWEEGLALTATARGIDDAALVDLLDELDIARGAVTAGPSGWRFLGSGQADGLLAATVVGITPPGDDLLETGYAPVELQVEERAVGSGPSGPVHVPGGIDVTGLDVRLRDEGGRPALVTQLEGGQRLVHTTTADGDAVTVSGPVPEADLLAIATGTTAIDPDDERLVGIPIGNVGSSPGRWCRDDR